MLRIFQIVFLFLFCTIGAQRIIPSDSMKLKETSDFLVDDYGSVYLYQKKDFSLTKYDSLGLPQAKLMLTLPFYIQSVQNPLSISSFSENAQELRFYDQNLVQIQTYNLRQNFGYVRAAYIEDLQQTWLIDESSNQIVQYNLQENRKLHFFPVDENFSELIDFLVFDQHFYFLFKNQLKIIDFQGSVVKSMEVNSPRKLRRENKRVFIIAENSIQEINDGLLKEIFSIEKAQFVDKNSSAYFVIKDNKLYLYPLK